MTEEQLQEFGQAMLEEACQFIDRFSVLPSRAARYALVAVRRVQLDLPAFTETPRLHISAWTYGAGKTRVMKLTNLLCPNPQMMAKITGPALYHVIPERHPAPLGLDEADALFGAGQRAEDIRGILNAGYEYNGTITRVVKSEATDYNVFCPVMFAGKGKLPKSLEDRSDHDHDGQAPAGPENGQVHPQDARRDGPQDRAHARSVGHQDPGPGR